MKKMISIILVLAMCMTFCIPVSADELNLDNRTVTESQIQAEIQSEETAVYDNVYEQLEAQDALSLMDIYKSILGPEIEMEVRAKYGEATPNSAPNYSYSYTAPYGGVVLYTSTLGANVAITYLDQLNTEHYILSRFSVSDIITNILGYIPSSWQNIFVFVLSLQSVATNSAYNSIDKAQGYSYVMNVYDPSTEDKGSVVLGWGSHPTINVYDSDGNPDFTGFQYHDPWS